MDIRSQLIRLGIHGFLGDGHVKDFGELFFAPLVNILYLFIFQARKKIRQNRRLVLDMAVDQMPILPQRSGGDNPCAHFFFCPGKLLFCRGLPVLSQYTCV